MNLIPYDYNKLMTEEKRVRTKLLVVLEEFIATNQKCVKIEDYTQRNAKVCRDNLYMATKRFKMQNTIQVVMSKGDVFLIRKDM